MSLLHTLTVYYFLIPFSGSSGQAVEDVEVMDYEQAMKEVNELADGNNEVYTHLLHYLISLS